MSIRDERGLTEKQRLSIPVIAAAETIRKGVIECVEKNILSSLEFFYKSWWRQSNYQKAVTDARSLLQGDAAERVRTIFLANIEATAKNIVKHASSSRSDSMRAAEIQLNGVGIDTGRGNRFKVSQTVGATIEEKQEDFRAMLERQLAKRARVLEGLRQE